MKKISLCLVSFLVLLSACGGENVPIEGKKGEMDEVEKKDWVFEVNEELKDHQLIVNMIVTNEQNAQGSLSFSSGQLYEIVLLNQSNEEVYRYSDGRMFTMAVTEQLFEPDESKKFQEAVPLENLEAGTYRLDAQFLVIAADEQEWTDKEEFKKSLEVTIQ